MFVDDLYAGRGVVLGRAATILRSIETQPFRLDDLSCQLDKSSELRVFPRQSFLPFVGGESSAFFYAKFFYNSKSLSRHAPYKHWCISIVSQAICLYTV